VLVLDREVERRAGRAALLRRREERGPADGLANLVAETEVVDDRRAVLHVSVEPDKRTFAIRLRLGPEQLERALRQQRAQRLAEEVDQRLEIIDEAAGERVLDDRPGGGDPRPRLDRLPPSTQTSSTTVTILRTWSSPIERA